MLHLKIRMVLLITALLDLAIAGVICVGRGLDKVARKTLAYAKRLSELNKMSRKEKNILAELLLPDTEAEKP